MVFGRTNVRKRVGLFGGSFNPPHIGHTAICKWLFARGIVDELWIVPCFIHPFDKGLTPFKDRLVMCQLAFRKLHLPIEVLDVERELGGVSHTLRTVEHLKSKHPDLRLYLVTGQDIEQETEEWHGFDTIRELVEIVRIPRGSGSSIPDVSSTEVRRRIDVGEPFADQVENEVAVYIVTKGLYR